MALRQCLCDSSITYINKKCLRLFLRGKIDCALVAFSCRIASPVYTINTYIYISKELKHITVSRLLSALFNSHIFNVYRERKKEKCSLLYF